MPAGAVARMETPGGGGFGAPRQSDPRDLAQHLADGKLSRAKALRDYGEDLVRQAELIRQGEAK
jgi:N-methylhydantoinase B